MYDTVLKKKRTVRKKMRSSKWVDRRDPRKWRVPTIVASICPDVSWSLLPASPSSTMVTMPRLLSINPHVEFIPQRALGATDLVHKTFLALLRILLLAHLPIGWVIEIQTLGRFFSGGGGIMFLKNTTKILCNFCVISFTDTENLRTYGVRLCTNVEINRKVCKTRAFH